MYTIHNPKADFLPGNAYTGDRFSVSNDSVLCPITKQPRLEMVGTREQCERYVKARQSENREQV